MGAPWPPAKTPHFPLPISTLLCPPTVHTGETRGDEEEQEEKVEEVEKKEEQQEGEEDEEEGGKGEDGEDHCNDL